MKYIYITFLLYITSISTIFAWANDLIKSGETWLPGSSKNADKILWDIVWSAISSFINYIAIFAVLSLMTAWIMYMLAAWEEEKAKKAKKWLIWNLVWVLLSVSALWIIRLINNITL